MGKVPKLAQKNQFKGKAKNTLAKSLVKTLNKPKKVNQQVG
jgi:hypothetical protein